MCVSMKRSVGKCKVCMCVMIFQCGVGMRYTL